MIEAEAKTRNFCVARVDLNESDAESPMSFFFKLFDATFNAACSFKKANGEAFCFAGPAGKTYDVYLDMISTYRVPDEKVWCPFLFPIQYAKAMANGVRAAYISEASFIADLKRIHEEVQRPITILFDECNVLSSNRVLLEMLRNIFMNIAGFMLVFTGTPDLFPVMDDVFSPIVRQFKKIEIDRFEDIEETKQCMKKPLESIGILDASEICDFSDEDQLKEIHELTGGRPYEIQLLCHFLFRRVQRHSARRMQLDVGVLDEVLAELGTGRELSSHPITAKIRRFDRGQLRALNTLTQCSGSATLEQLWFVESLFGEAAESARTKLAGRLEQFSRDGIIAVDDGIITFRGDEFDRIYAKYLARQERISLLFPEWTYERFFMIQMVLGCRSALELRFLGGLVPSVLFPPTYSQDVVSAIRQLPDTRKLAELFSTYPVDLAAGVYWSLLEQCENTPQNVYLVKLGVRTDWITAEFPFLFNSGPDGERQTAELSNKLDAMATRARSLGAELNWTEEESGTVPETEVLACAVESSTNQQLKTQLSRRHASRMSRDYLDKRSMKSALFHAALSQRYGPNSHYSNNIGYVYLANGDYQRAKEVFQVALAPEDFHPTKGLVEFNLGVAELMLGNGNVAREWLSKALKIWEDNAKDGDNILCLLVPVSTQSGLTLQERLNPKPLDIVKQVLADTSIFQRCL